MSQLALADTNLAPSLEINLVDVCVEIVGHIHMVCTYMAREWMKILFYRVLQEFFELFLVGEAQLIGRNEQGIIHAG